MAVFLTKFMQYRDRCPRCEGKVNYVEAYLSIHSIEFEICAGPGRVLVTLIPYCLACEEPPQTYGCLHMPYAYQDPLVVAWMSDLLKDLVLRP